MFTNQNNHEKHFPETNAMEEELNTPKTDESDEDQFAHLEQTLDDLGSDLDILGMILDLSEKDLHDNPDIEKIDKQLSAVESLLDGLKEPLEQLSKDDEHPQSSATQTVYSFYPLSEDELKQLSQI